MPRRKTVTKHAIVSADCNDRKKETGLAKRLVVTRYHQSVLLFKTFGARGGAPLLVIDLGLLVRRQFSWLRFVLRLVMVCRHEPDGRVVGVRVARPAFARTIRCRAMVLPDQASH